VRRKAAGVRKELDGAAPRPGSSWRRRGLRNGSLDQHGIRHPGRRPRGALFGYQSDMIFLPDHGVGAVILTNSDTGGYLMGFLQRRLLEVLFDGKPEAVEQARFAKTQRIAAIAKQRERLIVPADAAEVGKLAPRYIS